ncbi:MAG: response regulator transcription factor [Actinobacteria bacterium]|nr:response regulator transcription factor [Actinomycetota bacterium]
MCPIRVLIVDDHLAFARAVALRLQAEPDLEVVGCRRSAAEGEASARSMDPHVVLADLELGTDDGIDMVARLRSGNPRLRVLVLGSEEDAVVACAAIRAGASGFLTKAVPVDELVRAVRGVGRDETWISPRLLTDVLRKLQELPQVSGEQALVEALSRREREVLSLMMAGLDRSEIARRLFLSANTVRTHTRNLMAKLGVHSSVEAVSLALRAGLRPPRPADAQPQ